MPAHKIWRFNPVELQKRMHGGKRPKRGQGLWMRSQDDPLRTKGTRHSQKATMRAAERAVVDAL